MNFEALCVILKEWEMRTKDIDQFNKEGPYYHNGKRVIQLYRELAEFLQINEPAMRQWMMEYLDKNRKEVFTTWWTTHVSEWAKDQIQKYPKKKLHPNTQQEWDRIFGNEPVAKFDLAYRVTMDAQAKVDMSKCEDLTLLAYHMGKECDSNGWFCDLCDMPEMWWKEELQRRIANCAHPLLNVKNARFMHYGWRYKTHLEKLGDWIPPHFWGDYRTDGHEEKDCYDLEEYKTVMRTRRAKDYTKTGQTPKQAIDPMFFLMRYYGGWEIRFYEHYKTEYEAFILLWNKLDLLPLSFELDLGRLAEIEIMY